MTINPLTAMTDLETAVKVLRSMPPVRVRNTFCNWPPFVRSWWETYNSELARENLEYVRITPNARQISATDRVIFFWLPAINKHNVVAGKILWARADNKMAWKKIGKMVGLDWRECQSLAKVALFLICLWENEGAFK